MEFIPTPSQTVGPFFHFGITTAKHSVSCIASPGATGEKVWLTLTVLDGESQPLDDAMIEVWQADSNGKYNHPDDWQPKTFDLKCSGFGRLATREDGTCEFETIKPGRVPGSGDTWQAPHFNVAVFARGMLKQLYTRVYFAEDPSNSEDPVLALVPSDRHATLMAQRDPSRPSHWRFDLRLQGEQETVFFDV